MAETLWGTFKMNDPLVKGFEVLTPAHFEEVRLSVGGNTAVVGDLLVYDSTAGGSLAAATPATHRDVKLALALNSDTHAAVEMLGWHGQLWRPSVTPLPVAGVDWNPDTALVDAQQVIMLKRGAFGVVSKMFITDISANVLTGIGLSLSGTGGEVKPAVNTFTDTTPTIAETLNAFLSQVQEFVGYADSVFEDIGAFVGGIDVQWGST